MFLHDFIAMTFILGVLIMGTNFRIQEAVYVALDAFAFWSLKEPQWGSTFVNKTRQGINWWPT